MRTEAKPANEQTAAAATGVKALSEWRGARGLPDFSAFTDTDFAAAFSAALTEAEEEIGRLAADESAADIENFLTPFELAGGKLDKVCAIFFLLAGARSTAEIRRLE